MTDKFLRLPFVSRHLLPSFIVPSLNYSAMGRVAYHTAETFILVTNWYHCHCLLPIAQPHQPVSVAHVGSEWASVDWIITR